jgi:hypothetical protein
VGVPTVAPLQAVIEPYCGLDWAGAKDANSKRLKQVIEQSAFSAHRAPMVALGDCNCVVIIMLLSASLLKNGQLRWSAYWRELYSAESYLYSHFIYSA